MKELDQPKYNPVKQIHHYDDANEEEQDIIRQCLKLGSVDLLNIIDDKELDSSHKGIAKALLYDKLGVTPIEELHYYDEWFLHEELIPYLKGLVAEFNELKERFANHRHAMDKTYGEKPVW